MSDESSTFVDDQGRLFRFAGTTPIRCSFCGKEQQAVHKIIASEGAYICDECIALCAAIVTEEVLTEAPGPRLFRVGVRGRDGATQEVVVEPDGEVSVAWCWHCGTLLVGYRISDCLHCGVPLGNPPARGE